MSRTAIRDLPTIAFFSDVDGTMMDERGRLALHGDEAAAFASRVELVLTSSRTLVELARIQRRLGLVAALVGENGAVIGFPGRWRGTRTSSLSRIGGRDMEVVPLGEPAASLRRRMRRCASDARVSVVEQRDTLPDKGRSLRRTHSLCVRNWRGRGAERFLDALRNGGLEATRSGHWITITGGAHKGDGVRAVLARAERNGAPFRWSAGIGNAENDAGMLAACDRRFAIRNPRTGHDPALAGISRVRALTMVGLAGWREALDWILSR
jgi:predicted mannosyl-3-phosphoglycerate phosphatase (HAD superfamily)